jgi:hypothetical protein
MANQAGVRRAVRSTVQVNEGVSQRMTVTFKPSLEGFQTSQGRIENLPWKVLKRLPKSARLWKSQELRLFKLDGIQYLLEFLARIEARQKSVNL